MIDDDNFRMRSGHLDSVIHTNIIYSILSDTGIRVAAGYYWSSYIISWENERHGIGTVRPKHTARSPTVHRNTAPSHRTSIHVPYKYKYGQTIIHFCWWNGTTMETRNTEWRTRREKKVAASFPHTVDVVCDCFSRTSGYVRGARTRIDVTSVDQAFIFTL